jgi:hypothetical protein
MPPAPPLDACFAAQRWGAHGEGFRGSVAVTQSGLECQRWDRQYPHAHPYLRPKNAPNASLRANYCRNPVLSDSFEPRLAPWCFTTAEDTVWEYCQVCLANASALAPVPPAPPHHHPPSWVGFLALGLVLGLALVIGACAACQLTGQSCGSLLGAALRPRGGTDGAYRQFADSRASAAKAASPARAAAEMQPTRKQAPQRKAGGEMAAGTLAALSNLAAHHSVRQVGAPADVATRDAEVGVVPSPLLAACLTRPPASCSTQHASANAQHQEI